MSKLSLLLISFILSLTVHAQTSKDLVGKWKIIAVNNGVYYDYKKDSSYATKKFLDSLVGKKDSAETIEMFSSFARQYNDYYFSFDKDGKYQEIRNGEIRVFGTYKVDESKKIIDALYGNGGPQHPASFRFRYEKNFLILYAKSQFMSDELELTLERTP